MAVPPSTSVAVVGGGPAGLLAAEVLASAGAAVTVHERMPSVGRKLLLAGRSGLNLTHGEPTDALLDRYGPARPWLAPAVEAFDAAALRAWCEGLGQPTFVGSSGRVFPEALRATPLLRAWLRRLAELGVALRTGRRWTGWDEAGALRFDDGSTQRPDATVLALGGATWPRTGSDGGWVATLVAAGIEVAPLRPANAGLLVEWSPVFRERFAGQPVKDVACRHGEASSRGDAVITDDGLEGGPVYAVSSSVRAAVDASGPATLLLDAFPDDEEADVVARLGRRRPRDSAATGLARAGVPPVVVGLLREATGNRPPADAGALAALLKALPVAVAGTQPLARAISSSGGVARGAVDDRFMLVDRPGTFVAGEMLDWDAPTGGYLLQATCSTGVAAARGALAWLGAAA